jgi:hypothetical protein
MSAVPLELVLWVCGVLEVLELLLEVLALLLEPGVCAALASSVLLELEVRAALASSVLLELEVRAALASSVLLELEVRAALASSVLLELEVRAALVCMGKCKCSRIILSAKFLNLAVSRWFTFPVLVLL